MVVVRICFTCLTSIRLRGLDYSRPVNTGLRLSRKFTSSLDDQGISNDVKDVKSNEPDNQNMAKLGVDNVNANKDEDAVDKNLKRTEIGGPSGPEPTRYGDREKAGRCYDF